ncbi:MAG: metallopeptidase family protein [Candidatus Eisenbacteria bacterium]|nr:metallopeptidase family protein [Candidatus Eisenbacteria bacterium]
MSYETLNETEWEAVDQVYDLLEKGKVEQARLRLDGLMQGRREQPDLRIVDAAVSLDEGAPERALATLKGAERSADPSLFFHLRAIAHFEMVHLERARDDAERALVIQPDLAEAHDLLSRICEHLGDFERAAEHAAEAEAIDPDAFGSPLEVSDEEFDALVGQAVSRLPAEVRRHLDEVPVLVEPLPSREVLTAEDPPLSPELLGLFVGRHLLERSHADLPGVPGAIFLFRRNLLRACADREELEREVRITVQHEVGHLLGLDEDDLDRWGLA